MTEAADRLTTFMMLGRIHNEQEVAAGRRRPDEPQIQLSGEGWRIWGGEIEEPKAFTVAELYLAMLKEGTPEEAQKVLDMTRERCGELRLAAKRAKGKTAKEIEGHWERLRDELTEAQKIKIEKGLSSV